VKLSVTVTFIDVWATVLYLIQLHSCGCVSNKLTYLCYGRRRLTVDDTYKVMDLSMRIMIADWRIMQQINISDYIWTPCTYKMAMQWTHVG